MTDTTKITRPGALALLALERKAPEQVSALADLRALIARCERAERHAEAMADALDRVSRIAWHPEAEGAPALHNAHRWQVVEVCRAALAAYRAERGK